MTSGTPRVSSRTVYLAAALLVLLLLCVALSVCFLAGPRPPQAGLTPVPASDQAAQSGEDKLTSLFDSSLGPFVVNLTDEEATSLLALRLPGSPFLSPQVHFAGDRAYVSGVVNMGVALKVVSMWSVNQSGERPRVVLERATIGPFTLSPFLLNSVSSTINQMIDESGTGVMPTRVTIAEGQITVAGRKDPPPIP